jgi:hypothetical protein
MELAGPGALVMTEEDVTQVYSTARKQTLLRIQAVESELELEPIPPISTRGRVREEQLSDIAKLRGRVPTAP